MSTKTVILSLSREHLKNSPWPFYCLRFAVKLLCWKDERLRFSVLLANILDFALEMVKILGLIVICVYRRRLETCPQAKTFKSERSATTVFSSFFSDSFERRVWLSAESKILAFTFERFRLYRLKIIFRTILSGSIRHCRSYGIPRPRQRLSWLLDV